MMNNFDVRSKRKRLSGYRDLLKALEPGSGFILVQQGKNVNTEITEGLRREIAYLESVLIPETNP